MIKNIISFVIAALISTSLIYSLIPNPPVTKVYEYSKQSTPEDSDQNPLEQSKQNILESLVLPSYLKINNVPFTPQAPFADWNDIRQQEACEEASILMAAYWYLDLPLSKQIALDQILDIVKFEESNFGFHIHSDLEIAQEILKSFFMIQNTEIKYDISLKDIKSALANDSVVIAPMNGKKLKNPHFLNGGPENHMILIIGYDDKKEVFITHDPGTKNGENYEYTYDVIQESLYNYPNSNQQWTENRPKTGILTLSKAK